MRLCDLSDGETTVTLLPTAPEGATVDDTPSHREPGVVSPLEDERPHVTFHVFGGAIHKATVHFDADYSPPFELAIVDPLTDAGATLRAWQREAEDSTAGDNERPDAPRTAAYWDAGPNQSNPSFSDQQFVRRRGAPVISIASLDHAATDHVVALDLSPRSGFLPWNVFGHLIQPGRRGYDVWPPSISHGPSIAELLCVEAPLHRPKSFEFDVILRTFVRRITTARFEIAVNRTATVAAHRISDAKTSSTTPGSTSTENDALPEFTSRVSSKSFFRPRSSRAGDVQSFVPTSGTAMGIAVWYLVHDDVAACRLADEETQVAHCVSLLVRRRPPIPDFMMEVRWASNNGSTAPLITPHSFSRVPPDGLGVQHVAVPGPLFDLDASTVRGAIIVTVHFFERPRRHWARFDIVGVESKMAKALGHPHGTAFLPNEVNPESGSLRPLRLLFKAISRGKTAFMPLMLLQPSPIDDVQVKMLDGDGRAMLFEEAVTVEFVEGSRHVTRGAENDVHFGWHHGVPLNARIARDVITVWVYYNRPSGAVGSTDAAGDLTVPLQSLQRVRQRAQRMTQALNRWAALHGVIGLSGAAEGGSVTIDTSFPYVRRGGGGFAAAEVAAALGLPPRTLLAVPVTLLLSVDRATETDWLRRVAADVSTIVADEKAALAWDRQISRRHARTHRDANSLYRDATAADDLDAFHDAAIIALMILSRADSPAESIRWDAYYSAFETQLYAVLEATVPVAPASAGDAVAAPPWWWRRGHPLPIPLKEMAAIIGGGQYSALASMVTENDELLPLLNGDSIEMAFGTLPDSHDDTRSLPLPDGTWPALKRLLDVSSRVFDTIDSQHGWLGLTLDVFRAAVAMVMRRQVRATTHGESQGQFVLVPLVDMSGAFPASHPIFSLGAAARGRAPDVAPAFLSTSSDGAYVVLTAADWISADPDGAYVALLSENPAGCRTKLSCFLRTGDLVPTAADSAVVESIELLDDQASGDALWEWVHRDAGGAGAPRSEANLAHVRAVLMSAVNAIPHDDIPTRRTSLLTGKRRRYVSILGTLWHAAGKVLLRHVARLDAEAERHAPREAEL